MRAFFLYIIGRKAKNAAKFASVRAGNCFVFGNVAFIPALAILNPV